MGKVLASDYPANKMMRLVVPLLVLLFSASALRAQEWAQVPGPAPGPTQVIGFYTAGCIQGAEALPLQGPGYEAIRVSRNRYWGHPVTIDYIRTLAERVRSAGQSHLYIGDIGQARGGPMSFGHASHQNGLDVDIWLNLDPKQSLPAALREDPPLPSMVLADHTAVDPARFGPAQVTLLRLAATDPKVDRVFVHWTIKRALCDGVGGAGEGDRAWLRRIRPWRGHDSHFHVRLRCPAGSPRCVEQAAVHLRAAQRLRVVLAGDLDALAEELRQHRHRHELARQPGAAAALLRHHAA